MDGIVPFYQSHRAGERALAHCRDRAAHNPKDPSACMVVYADGGWLMTREQATEAAAVH